MSEFRENMQWLGRFYRPLKNRFIILACQSVAVAMVSASIPYCYIRIVDGIQQNLSSDFIFQSVLLLFSLGILNFLLSVTNATRRAKTNIELEWKFRQNVFARLLHWDQNTFNQFRTGDLVTRLTDDVGRKLSWFACSGIFRAWESFLRIMFCMVAMFIINPKLTLIALIPYPFQILIYFKTTQILDSRFKYLQTIISQVNETIETCFSGIKIVQSYCAENRHAIKFANVAENRASAEISAEKAHIFVHSLYGYFWQIAQVIVLVAGGWMVINNTLTVGEYVAFDYYIMYLVWPMFDIGGLLVGYRRAAVSIKRLRELDHYIPAIESPPSPVQKRPGPARIAFNNVTFSRNQRDVLRNITFDAGDHRMIAVVGEIGSGKTSLLDLICRFYDPDSGHITVDGIPIHQLSLSELRHLIGYVSQEPLLFTDTIRNNIRFGREFISDETLLWAAEIAQLTPEIERFTRGLDTEIGLRGMTVSGGQKQRISIARALAGSPTILILDDATAHLDAETEDALWKRIFDVLPHIRTFVTSHRTSTLERADLILVIRNGILVEHGQHEDLMTAQGEYYRIYSKQKLRESVKTTHSQLS